jgi:glycosyltransferase involved in cell wall biosynthesis
MNAAPRCAFIMEQTLGHVTHYLNMRSAIDTDSSIRATWLPLTFPPQGWVETLPVVRRNWSARASLRTRRMLGRGHTAAGCRALFFHTQVTTLLSTGLVRRVPSIISLDATPLNYDAVGRGYGHAVRSRRIEKLKLMLYKRPLVAAGAVVTWSAWARRSLIEDYGIAADKITVIAPGVPLAQWPEPATRSNAGALRILFVGADFDRKGGEDLLLAAAQLPRPVELHLVTKAPIPERPGGRVYRDLGPNSELLKQLYARADIFVLPTLADCFPLVIQEAMAAGLPVIATDVGAIGQAVIPGHTGQLVPPRDPRALAHAITALQEDATQRNAMSREARLVAEQRFDSRVNAGRIVDLMHGLIEARPRQAVGT